MNPLDLVQKVTQEVEQIKETPSDNFSKKQLCLNIIQDLEKSLLEGKNIQPFVKKLQNSVKEISSTGNNHVLEVTRFTEALLNTLADTNKLSLSSSDKKAIDSIYKALSSLIDIPNDNDTKEAIQEVFTQRNYWKTNTLGMQKTFSNESVAIFYDNEKDLVLLRFSSGITINFDTLKIFKA